MNRLHVRHVREALERQFLDLIDIEDLAKYPERHRKQAFLSRALAALALQYLTGVDAHRAAVSVIDGFDDGGFDAVLVEDNPPRLWLVQSKWSDEGKAGLALGDPGKMHTGLDQLVNGEFDKFNSKFQAMANEVDAVVSESDVKIILVVAQMGASTLTTRVKDAFDRILRDFNSPGEQQMISLEVIGLTEFHNMIRAGVAAPRIDLAARLDSPGFVGLPYRAFQGTLNAETVSEWFQEYGQRLFDQNIRKALGITRVNKSLIETILSTPEHFLYFNNGITLLCESIHRNARHASAHGAPIDLSLRGVSIVNGAQTVASMHEAMRVDPEAASNAKVWVRLISLEDCPNGFAAAVTQATNTQNLISLRDFVSLDETQVRLRDEFALSLDKTYIIKRGDTDPDPSTGCSVVEAAVALACTHPNLEYTVRARYDGDVLYEKGEQGAYTALFNRSVHAYRVWRSVQLLRAVRASLGRIREDLTGRAAQIAVQGDLLVAHTVSQVIGQSAFNELDHDWDDGTMKMLPEHSRSVFVRLVAHIDELYSKAPIHSVFKNRERTTELVRKIVQEIRDEVPEPELAPNYRATRTERRFNAVALIVDRGLIPDGTVLEFRPGTGSQRRLFGQWLAHDSKRGRATWTNDRAKPLIWEMDRRQYSADGLVRHMTSLLTSKPSSAGQGTRRWYLPGQGCLADIAGSALIEDEFDSPADEQDR